MDRHTLIKRIDEGLRPKFRFFWGPRQKLAQARDASCLSQWFPSEFAVEGDTYATAEHWMMAEKARLFGDEEIRTKILACESPGKARALGRRVREFDDAIWRARRVDIVVQGNVHKFSQHEDLRRFLVNTGTKILVEASPYDCIWGIGLRATDSDACSPARWQGQNLLGFALMAVRERLGGATSSR